MMTNFRSDMPLSPDQEQALVACKRRLASHGEALLCGAAGTGKTYLMGQLGQSVKLMALAPTNAAARVLRGKLPDSIPVSTIHAAAMQLSRQSHQAIVSFLEKLLNNAPPAELVSHWNDLEPEHIQDCMSDELADMMPWILEEHQHEEEEALVKALTRARKHNRLVFDARDGQPTKEIELLVVDEASMCTSEHRDAIRKAFPGQPVWWVGDDAQLPPVIDEEDAKRGIKPVLALLGPPTARLTQQHRQEEGSILLAALERLRGTHGPVRPKLGQFPGMEVIARPKSGITKGLIRRFAEHCGPDGVAICWRNTSRRKINRELRALRGMEDWMPVEGERLVVQMTPRRERDIRDPDWTRGTLVEVVEVLGPQPKGNFNELELACVEVGGQGAEYVVRCGVVSFLETYQSPRMSWALYGDWLLDYAHCLTAHKAQGSEFDNVAIYEERGFELVTNGDGQQRSKFVGWPSHRKWLYTALSRTRRNALLVMQGD